MSSETKRTIFLFVLAIVFSALFFGYGLVWGKAICEAIVMNGGDSCKLSDRVSYYASDGTLAIVPLVVSIFSGAIAAVVVVFVVDFLRDRGS